MVEPLSKRRPLALVSAAIAVLLAGNAQPQDADRQNANRTSQATQVAHSDTGIQTLEHHLQNKTLRVSKLVGLEVQSRSRDSLGQVHDIARNAAPGQKLQLIVALAGIVGDNQKLVAIPFDEIQISADSDELYTNRTRDQLAGLPAVTLDAGTAGAAGVSRSATPASPGSIAAAGTAALRERRVGDLVGVDVIGSDGDQVGEIDDIVLSTAGADSVRAVLHVGGIAGIGEKRVSLPLNQVAVERVGDNPPTLRVSLDAEALERLPEFEYEDQTAAL